MCNPRRSSTLLNAPNLFESYRDLLRQHLLTKKEQNPRYSLRAFARDLGLSPGRLSEILNGKQGMSQAWAMRVAKHLGLEEIDQEMFCILVQSEDARSRESRKTAAQWAEQLLFQPSIARSRFENAL